MLAVVAAVLFALALVFELASLSLSMITSSLLVTAGLLCLALYFAGVGAREVTYRRRSRR